MNKKEKIQKLTSFFYEVGNLRKVMRAHQQMLLSEDLTDNIASHTLRTVFIGYFLAKELKADADKVIKMCLLHDLEEVRSADQNWVHKRYLKVFEEEIRDEQLKGVPHSEELINLSKEYQKRKTLEAKIAKDADLLDEVLLLREYWWRGSKEAGAWLKVGTRKKSRHEKMISTGLARELAEEIKKQDPTLWWKNLWTPTRRK